MAVVVEVGVSAMIACSGSGGGRPWQGGAICSSSQVSAMSPLRLWNKNGYTSSNRAVMPTSRGLRLCSGALANRLPATATPGRASQKKGIVCEASEAAVETTRVEKDATGVVSDDTFNELVICSEIPVLVDFWAPWCGPCRMIAPLIEELAHVYKGKLLCLKLNTDESPRIATEYGIRSIPTVMIFKRGEKQDTVIGAVPMSTLTATVEKYI